jgi:glyoxylase-like metal-dependent hydrolase (beta-lactamase superfamily II)
MRWWKRTANAPLWIHEMDARVVERFRERTALTGRDMAVFLAGAGCEEKIVKKLVAMYLESKEVYDDVPVDRRLRHAQKLFDNRARVIHTPGHCPGHVCLRVDDTLLVADQVLSPITPHLSPQFLHPNNGLERYLHGIGRLATEDGAVHILPAHYEPIPDLGARVREIAEDHVAKLDLTLDACANGATVVDVMQKLFGAPEGYNVLLATLEAGTHVEYLHQVGSLAVQNVDEVASDPTRPLKYITIAPHSAREIAPVG